MQLRRKWWIVPALALGAVLLASSLQYAQAASKPTRSVYRPRVTQRTPPKTGTKIVPILSVGTPGLRLGMAQVSGPASQTTRVQAVLQLDAEYKGVRAKILVPSYSLTSLRRVQQTAVTAVVQYQLIDFTPHKKAQQASPPPNTCPANTPTVTPRGNVHHDNGWHGRHNKHGRQDRGNDEKRKGD